MNHLSKRLLLIILAAVLIASGVSGCMKKEQPRLHESGQQEQEEVKPDPEIIKEQVLSYLEEKYGEEFVPMTFSDSNWAYSYKSMYLYPKNGSEADYFEVRGTKKSDGTYRFSDGYIGKYISQEYAEVVSGFVREFSRILNSRYRLAKACFLTG
ncbi:hypothetical protein [Fontibacillus sp. BL9]|uniref:hypothetical protein n=1 Tax=Fontibacillus sp. BL9 TaxID=3389971 RepID=UPI00397E686F